MTFPSLTLLTERFPYGAGEEFLEAELPFLAQAFASIAVVPTARLSITELQGPTRLLPANVQLRRDVAGYLADRRQRGAIRRGLSLWYDPDALHLIMQELAICRPHAHGGSGGRRWRHWPRRGQQLLQYLGHAVLVRDALRHFQLMSATYGFWLNAGVLGAHLAGAQPLVCRAHGADLYVEREASGYLPLHAATMARVARVFFISQHGLAYATARYPWLRERFALARLGVLRPLAPARQGTLDGMATGPLQLLSCAGLRPIKRIDFLIAALALCKTPVLWTHLGDGSLRQVLERAAKALPAHIQVRFLGHLDHAEVLAYYQENPVDLFVNVSAHEGLPVSIMEALSHGVPTLALDVGGVGELVSSKNGMLLPAAATPGDVAAALERFCELSSASRAALRAAATASWQRLTDAEQQYPAFCAALLASL